MYVVAEMSANHNGKLETALEIVEKAAEAGADAVKLQTYTPDGMSLDPDLQKLYRKGALPRKWHRPIFERARELGITCFSAPFTIDDVDFLESLDCPMYKVASFEITDIPLVEYIASKRQPMIISAGMATVQEINLALRAAQDVPVTLLKCTSAYPATPREANILTIPDMAKKYPHVTIGISDHTPGIGVAVAAVGLGAQVVEKHFTVERKGLDKDVSLMPTQFAQLVEECHRAEDARGKVYYGVSPGEWTQYRRSLWVVKDIAQGETLTHGNIRSLRPVGGLDPAALPVALGKVATRDLARGEPLTWASFH